MGLVVHFDADQTIEGLITADQRTQAQKNIGLYKVVRFDIDQTVLRGPATGETPGPLIFTDADRVRARKNIGVEEDYVRYDAVQYLSAAQKQRARDNIGITLTKGDKGDTGAAGPAGPPGPPGPPMVIPDFLAALAAIPGFLLSLLSLLISMLTACGQSTGDSNVDTQLDALRAYVIALVNSLLNNGTFKAKRRAVYLVVDQSNFISRRSGRGGGGGGRISIEKNDFHSFKRTTNQTFNNRFSVERQDYHLNQRSVNQVLHQHRSVQIDSQQNYTLDLSKIAALERRIAALEAA